MMSLHHCKELQDVGFDIEDKGCPVEEVSIDKQKDDDGSYEFMQCALIDSIIDDVGLSYTKARMKPVPTAGIKTLHTFKDSPSLKNYFYTTQS